MFAINLSKYSPDIPHNIKCKVVDIRGDMVKLECLNTKTIFYQWKQDLFMFN